MVTLLTASPSNSKRVSLLPPSQSSCPRAKKEPLRQTRTPSFWISVPPLHRHGIGDDGGRNTWDGFGSQLLSWMENWPVMGTRCKGFELAFELTPNDWKVHSPQRCLATSRGRGGPRPGFVHNPILYIWFAHVSSPPCHTSSLPSLIVSMHQRCGSVVVRLSPHIDFYKDSQRRNTPHPDPDASD